MVRKLKKKKVVNIKGTLVKMKELDYIINFGDDTASIMDRYYKGLDLLEKDNYSEAESIFNSLISQVRGHFDSLISLIALHQDRGHFPNVAKIFNVGIKDMRYILSLLPTDAKLPWAYSSNKSFLQFVYKLGIRYLNLQKLKEAKDVFLLLLQLDPEDHLDAKEVLIEVLFELGDFNSILELTENLEDIKNNSTIYSRILALFALEKYDEAKEVINSLNEDNLKIFNLLNAEVERNKDITEYISYSAIEDKSQFYWENFFRYWDHIDGSLEFLENHIRVKNLSFDSEPKENLIDKFKKSLIDEKLKEVTISGHLNNLELFKDQLHSLDEVVKKLESEVEGLNKTLFTKTITSLNKFYTFSTEDKEELKGIKSKLKLLKDKHIVKF